MNSRLTHIRRKPLIIASVILLAIIGICVFGYDVYVGFTEVKVGENVHAMDGLPSTASNISFRKSYSFTAFEFDIPQADFIRWSDEKGWHANPISRPAYLFNWKRESIQIMNGLSYAVEFPDGGGTRVAYDAATGRAYYESTPR